MIKLIPNWQRAHRMLSMQLWALNGAVHYGWSQIDDGIKALIPHGLAVGAAVVLFALPIAARLIDQGAVTAAPEGPKP
ncbi:MAG: hypothetical protein ACTHK2_04520 [Dokdonella sp.]|uniref:DUF7940 domain-containing protein n=1 Tax=Dokdonella sp. TaxID=2291710 RepID=UPI003F7F73F4